MPPRISFITMGCAKNEEDSATMQRLLVNAGYDIALPGGECDVIVVNTCSFIQPAIEESIEAILDVAELEEVQKGAIKLVVCGCLPSRFGADLEEELTEADRFVPCADESNIVSVIASLVGAPQTSECTSAQGGESPRLALRFNPSEYVKISEGCSRSCAFCTIPSIRGPYHSHSYSEIRSDVARKVAGGTREIVLIAQDSGLWGLDLAPKSSLAHLLDHLASEFPAIWFRVMYLQPAALSDELLEVMAAHENICHYLDIPLQHCDASILKSMNRRGSRAEMEAVLSRVRKRIPDVVLRTTLIVGYPGETEEQFEDLCDFVSEVEFDYVGIFAFSPEEGTVAAALPDQIDADTKLYRAQVLRDVADAVSSARIARRVGVTCDVLVLGIEEDGQLFGRAQCQAPEVDGVTYLDQGEVGSFVRATIEDTLLYEMEAVHG